MTPPAIALSPVTVPWLATFTFGSRSPAVQGGLRVREWPPRYEDEGSERIARGSVSVGAEAWWSVALSIPDGSGGSLADTVFLRLQRHGAHPPDYRGDVVGELTLPRTEVDAIAALLAGVVEQARRNGVLGARTS